MSIGTGTSNVNIELKYHGFEQSYTSDNIQTNITYQSTQEKLLDTIYTSSGTVPSGKWKCGQTNQYGRLDNIRLTQDAGPFWNATLTYNQPLSNGITISSGDDKKATQNSLTVRMLSRQIEQHPNYRYYWNHILIKKSNVTTVTVNGTSYNISTPAGVVNLYAAMNSADKQTSITMAQDVVNNSSGAVKWIEDASQLPTETQMIEVNNTPTKVSWQIACMQTKAGVEYYQIPTYEVTEYSKHVNREDAAWSIAQKSGKPRFPTYGDFGLQNKFYPGDAASGVFHWLCLGGNINFDGKYWVAQCTYQWADGSGWDTEIYPCTTSDYDYDNKNDIFTQAAPNNN